jgi:hypothetical protein
VTPGGRAAIVLLAAATLLARPLALGAQPPVPPARPDPLVLRDSLLRDSLRQRGDTGRVKRVIKWDAEDSVMSALLQRRGYSVTRYQGSTVVFHAGAREILIRGGPAIVSKDSATLVGDTIEFNDSTQMVVARGDTLLLRDPTQGDDDVIGRRELRYDVRNRVGVVFDVNTSVVSGQRWVLYGHVFAFKGDTTAAGNSAFYARDGSLTSCTEPVPHYHFAAKEMKFITRNVMVARSVVLYIADIPVFWLPFVFQDMRSGRRSGIIAPQFGFTEIVRNSPTYRRTIENFGYYFAISDHLDAQTTLDWRSNARPNENDPGWMKLNGRVRYQVRDLFLSGELGVSAHYLRNGATNRQYSLSHRQQFSQRTSLTANLNYVTNTVVQRNTTFNPYAALQTISSTLNYQTARGPLSINIGGTQQQYSGREEINRSFPSINVTSKPITAGDWLVWTPGLQLSNNEHLHIDQVGDFAYRYRQRAGGGLDSAKIDRNTRDSQLRFDTPVQIHGFNWQNSVTVSDRLQDFPSLRTVVDVNDTANKAVRVYRRTYVTSLDWQTSFSLPRFSQGRWNLSPTVQIQKVDGRSGLLVRTERTGGRFVAQPLRPAVGLSVSPTLFRFFPGIGPLSRIRQSVTPVLSFAYTPKGNISDEFLAANGDTRIGYLGDKQQNTVSLSLSTVFEGKLRSPEDSTAPQQAQKVRLLSLDFTPLSYDFERARVTRSTGLTNTSFGWTARSDLLPGFDFGVDYSLFQGDPISDTATFKPFRQSIRGSLSLGATSPLARGIARLLGFDADRPAGTAPPVPSPAPAPGPASANFIAGQPIAGSINQAAMSIPRGQGWTLNLTYSSNRQRPPRGGNVADFDPTTVCAPYKGDQFAFQQCVQQQSSGTATNGSLFTETTRGGTYFRTPPQTNAQSTMSFHITQHWAASWGTTYDFELRRFASQIVSLQREMHDWDAVFSFTRAPNGNFAFLFHIALRAQPDIKFDFPRRDYPRDFTGPRR